jgi:hypothetical protein
MSKHGTALATKKSARRVLVRATTIGVDLGDQWSNYCMLDEDGEITEEGRFRASMLNAGAGSSGPEWIASPKVAFAAYYRAGYYPRIFSPDTTNQAHPGTIMGYGGPGSPNTNKWTIREVIFDWLHKFWKIQGTERCRGTRSIRI